LSAGPYMVGEGAGGVKVTKSHLVVTTGAGVGAANLRKASLSALFESLQGRRCGVCRGLGWWLR
jgi:hypothetical protein